MDTDGTDGTDAGVTTPTTPSVLIPATGAILAWMWYRRRKARQLEKQDAGQKHYGDPDPDP